MRLPPSLLLLTACIVSAAPQYQLILPPTPPALQPAPPARERVGPFSEWSIATKRSFLADLRNNVAEDWIVVLGNEGGDTDSLASALSWAYHLSHAGIPQVRSFSLHSSCFDTEANDPRADRAPQKAVALLQTEEDALDLRPENKLALHYAAMSQGHQELLTISEVFIKTGDLYHRIKGLALVDHNVPRRLWGNASVLSIIDHHVDRGTNLSARPRVFEMTASCASIVADLMLEDIEKREMRRGEGGGGDEASVLLPVELVEFLLRTIALDSGGLAKGKHTKLDRSSATRLLERSSWRGRQLKEVMKALYKDMNSSKNTLNELSLRDLLRRDWKGDAIATKSTRYPFINIGFASIPFSLEEQIRRTPESTAPEWFAIERSWTAEIGADVSVALSSFEGEAGQRVHEICLVVATGWGKRLHAEGADSLFREISRAITRAPELNVLEEWQRPDGKPLLARRAAWRHYNPGAGRKLIRPIVENAIKEWEG